MVICHVTWQTTALYEHNGKALYDYSLEALKVSHHPTKFGGNAFSLLLDLARSRNGTVMRLTGRSPSRQVTILQSSVAIAILVVEL